MIAGWLAYCIAVSVLLAAAAICAEAILTRRGRAARWVWAAMIAASLLIPAVALVLQRRGPTPLPRAGDVSPRGIMERAVVAAESREKSPARHGVTVAPARPRAPEVAGIERGVIAFMIACVALAGLRVLFDSVLLYRRRRRWTPRVVDDVPVLVSDDIGPAIVGLIEPVIVLPRWTEGLSRDERALMLAHEREHLRAHDGTLTTVALLTMVVMPWNPMVWWALRRLRTAIEVDCDRRVLREFPDVTRYGRLLVDVAQRAVGSSFAVAGFSERAAPLAQRIQAMTTAVRPHRPFDLLSAGAGTLALAAAVAVLPPAADARQLAGYGGAVTPLPKNVGDSIAEGESPPRVVAAARGLPPVFSVVDYGPADQTKPLAAKCAGRLRDDRDGTRLLLTMGTTTTSLVVERADTAWNRIQSFGFYIVTPSGRYGVANDQTLRVGCGAFTRVSVGDRDLELIPGATLDSPDDDRARRVAAGFAAQLHLAADAAELRSGRLDVVFTDTTATIPSADAAFGRRAFVVLREVLGATAVPETLAVSWRRGKHSWSTSYYYWSMQK